MTPAELETMQEIRAREIAAPEGGTFKCLACEKTFKIRWGYLASGEQYGLDELCAGCEDDETTAELAEWAAMARDEQYRRSDEAAALGDGVRCASHIRAGREIDLTWCIVPMPTPRGTLYNPGGTRFIDDSEDTERYGATGVPL